MMLNASSNSPSSPRGGLEQEAPAGSLAIAGQEDAMSMGLSVRASLLCRATEAQQAQLVAGPQFAGTL